MQISRVMVVVLIVGCAAALLTGACASKPKAALIGSDSNQRSSQSPADIVKRSSTSRRAFIGRDRRRFAVFQAWKKSRGPPPTLGGVSSKRPRSTSATASSRS